jgi:hypothetical protein
VSQNRLNLSQKKSTHKKSLKLQLQPPSPFSKHFKLKRRKRKKLSIQPLKQSHIPLISTTKAAVAKASSPRCIVLNQLSTLFHNETSRKINIPLVFTSRFPHPNHSIIHCHLIAIQVPFNCQPKQSDSSHNNEVYCSTCQKLGIQSPTHKKKLMGWVNICTGSMINRGNYAYMG